jgi:hypothetical protein
MLNHGSVNENRTDASGRKILRNGLLNRASPASRAPASIGDRHQGELDAQQADQRQYEV